MSKPTGHVLLVPHDTCSAPARKASAATAAMPTHRTLRCCHHSCKQSHDQSVQRILPCVSLALQRLSSCSLCAAHTHIPGAIPVHAHSLCSCCKPRGCWSSTAAARPSSLTASACPSSCPRHSLTLDSPKPGQAIWTLDLKPTQAITSQPSAHANAIFYSKYKDVAT